MPQRSDRAKSPGPKNVARRPHQHRRSEFGPIQRSGAALRRAVESHVGFGIGIAHGYATLGTIGFEGRFDYAAIGTVSNVASRLCDEAKPGQILISPRVFMAVKDAVTVEPVGEFTLKGIGRPLAAYNVLAAAPPNA